MTDATEQRIPLDADAVDQAAIEAVLRVGGVALLERLVEVAEGNVRVRLRQIEAALAVTPPDAAAAERAAHSIKSSAAYLGVEALRRHAAAMEQDAREGRFDDLPAGVGQARRLLEQALPALRREIRVRRDEDCT